MSMLPSARRCAAAAVFAALAGAAPADITGFGDFSGWQINQGDTEAAPATYPDQDMVRLTDATRNEARTIILSTPQRSSRFVLTFTYRALSSAPNNSTGGSVFFENDPRGDEAIGGTGDVAYGGGDPIKPSGAIALWLQTSATAYYKQGLTGGGRKSTGDLNLASGNPIDVTLDYDGKILKETLHDTVADKTFTNAWTVDLVTDVGGPTALVGFGAGNFCCAGVPAEQFFSEPHMTCRPDCTRDGKLNVNDFLCFQSAWRKQTWYADYNNDGKWNINDFIAYQADFRAGCS